MSCESVGESEPQRVPETLSLGGSLDVLRERVMRNFGGMCETLPSPRTFSDFPDESAPTELSAFTL